jgi:fluoride ion exporter CrcB/FEX
VERVLLIVLGAIGTVARYLTSLVVLRRFAPEFP